MAWSAPGDYRVRLTASNSLGSDTAEIVVTVVDEVDSPTAVIAPTATNLVVGQSALLVSRSTGNPTSTDWDFGDGTTARGAEVRHAWDAPGTYTVALTVANRAGRDRTTLTVNVAPVAQAPTARFTVNATTVETGTAVVFTSTSTGDPTSLVWDFGDGTTGSGATASKTYARPGTYTVRLTATNAVGTSATTRTVSVVANVPPPVPAISVSPDTIRVGDPVQFGGSSTGGPVSSWSWSFGDGGTGSSQQNPGRVFATAGTFTVTLTAENLAGSASTSRSVVVLPARPVAGFTLAPSVPAAGTPIQFTDTSTGTVDTWSWSFGDGRTSSLREPSIAYASAGTYEVTLTVTNAGGSSTTQRTVAVNPPPPVASFTAPATALTNQPVVFTDTSTAVQASYAWTFGDLGSSTVRSPSFAFPAPGTYTVTLVVTNAGGSDTATRTVQVTNPPPPQAGFTASRTVVTTGQSVTFTNTSVAINPAYSWSFGDPILGTSTAPSPSFTFTAPGTFPVTLVVTNAGGSDTATLQVTVVAPAQPSFTATVTGTQVLLQDASTGADAIRIGWGDGSPLQAAAPGDSVSHDYAPGAVATISVSARNAAGDWSAPATVVVTIPADSTTTTGSTPPP
jgi:PKD repeat protein